MNVWKMYAAFVAAAALLLASVPSQAAAWPYDSEPFCQKRTLRDLERPLEGLPAVRTSPESRHLPFAPKRVWFWGESGSVAVGGYPLRYRFGLSGASRGTRRLDWEIESGLVRVDRDGASLFLVKRKVERIDRVEHARDAAIGFGRTPRPGLYRYDIAFRKDGRLLGRYHDYYRVVRRSTDVRLVLSGSSFRPGDLILGKLRNYSTEWLFYGVGYTIQSFDGGSWVPVDFVRLFGHPLAFILIGLNLPPGMQEECSSGFTVPETMAPGRYRMVKPVTMQHIPRFIPSERRERQRWVVAEFTVEPPA